MTVSVIVPWRGGCPHREAAWAWVRERYEQDHPTWEVVTGECSGPWVKALAVRDALKRASGDVLVISDADVWCDGLGAAVDDLTANQWVVPHRMVYRFDSAATERIIGGRSTFDEQRTHLTEKPYQGVPGGGIVILERWIYERLPLDPRFIGWGQEDVAYGYALRTMLGKPNRHRSALYHLWHPPAPRKSRGVGSDQGERLLYRYIAARRQEQMAALIGEVT